MVSDLKWESLADRRTKTKLTMCYKIYNGLVDIPFDRYMQHQAPTSTRVTRQNLKPPAHRFQIKEPSSDVDYLDYTYFYSVPPYWNVLPANIAGAPSLNSFKSQMQKLDLQCLPATRFTRGQQAP